MAPWSVLLHFARNPEIYYVFVTVDEFQPFKKCQRPVCDAYGDICWGIDKFVDSYEERW